MKPAPLLCLIALGMATAACNSKQAKSGEAEAAGEVLPGSASDAMLPYDTVRSQPPLAPQTEAAVKPGASGAKGTASEAAEDADAAASEAPAPTIVPPKPEASGGA